MEQKLELYYWAALMWLRNERAYKKRVRFSYNVESTQRKNQAVLR